MRRFLLIVFLLAPALYAQTDTIVFSREMVSWNTTYSMDIRSYLRAVAPDGSHERDLRIMGTHPAISPDGKLIAYCSNKDSSAFQVWIAAASGANARRVVEIKEGSSCDPAWSPDGRQLAFVIREKKDAAGTIAIVNVDGSGQRTLAPGTHPSWSGTGDAIVYQELAGKYLRVVVIKPDGSGKRVLVEGDENDFAPAWSPDGKTIAFVSDRNEACAIYLSAADGSGSLHRLAFSEKGQVANPAWFRDSTRVVFEIGARNGTMRDSKARCTIMMLPHIIAAASIEGGGPHLVTRTDGVHPNVGPLAEK